MTEITKKCGPSRQSWNRTDHSHPVRSGRIQNLSGPFRFIFHLKLAKIRPVLFLCQTGKNPSEIWQKSDENPAGSFLTLNSQKSGSVRPGEILVRSDRSRVVELLPTLLHETNAFRAV
jgi:hypothetical protein